MSKIGHWLRGFLTFSVGVGGILLMVSFAHAGPGKKGHAHGHDAKTESQGAHGHGSHGDHSAPGGMPGEAKNVSRTIVVIAKDNAFNLKKIQVKDGETIRFIIRNKGELLHEFTIGTHEMQKQHQAEMMKMMEDGHMTATSMMPGMNHSHGNSAMVEPGKEAEVIWMFHKGATIEFGCNVPGHYESGMKGDFVIAGSV